MYVNTQIAHQKYQLPGGVAISMLDWQFRDPGSIPGWGKSSFASWSVLFSNFPNET